MQMTISYDERFQTFLYVFIRPRLTKNKMRYKVNFLSRELNHKI